MKIKLIALKGVSFLTSLLPISVYLFINREIYFKTIKSGLGIGIFIILIVALFSLKDRLGDVLKHNAMLKVSIFLLVFSFYFQSVSQMVMSISLMTLIGSAVSLIPQHFEKKISIERQMEKQAQFTQKAMTNALNELTITKKK